MNDEIVKTKELRDALYKKAVGFKAQEETLEYALTDSDLLLVKKKIVTKEVAPDLAALKVLLEETKEDYIGLTDEEMAKEFNRLLGELDKLEKSKKKHQ